MSEDFIDNLLKEIPGIQEKIKREHFEKGLPICYEDDQGNWIHEYEDGRKVICEFNEDQQEWIETERFYK